LQLLAGFIVHSSPNEIFDGMPFMKFTV